MGERLLVIQAFAFHQGPFGPLDQAPRVQRHLELVGQRALELSLGRGPEQAGERADRDPVCLCQLAGAALDIVNLL
jgi:hypothetical protein